MCSIYFNPHNTKILISALPYVHSTFEVIVVCMEGAISP